MSSPSSVDHHGKPGEHHFAHHFRSALHEFVTCKQGMWLFLVQEVLFFSPLFVAYFMFRAQYAHDFHLGALQLDWKMGALNTIILLCSSYTMARAVTASQRGEKSIVKYLAITFLCAAGFLVVKYFEYTHKIHDGLLPGKFMTNPELLAEAPKAAIFFSLYFCMTGLHGIHVIGGMGVIAWIMWRAHKGEFGPKYFTPVEMTGLYWHFVDLVWIFLFPMLYLVG